MLAGGIRPPSVLRRRPGLRHENRQRPRTSQFSSPLTRDVSAASDSWNEREMRTFKDTNHTTQKSSPRLEISRQSEPSGECDLRFDKPQIDPESDSSRYKRVFGSFVAREALLDEEYWTAAWLRAESIWEDQPCSRYIHSYKKKFAEQEFTALKRRCGGQRKEKCTCIVAVRKEKKNVKQTILKSIVGTLDISIRCLLLGETFPGEGGRTPFNFNIYRTDQPKYGYISNVCVAKYARRQGIANNMMHLALDAVASHGVDQIFVHVHRDNISAQKLYEKIGFQIVGSNKHQHSHMDCSYLMSLRT